MVNLLKQRSQHHKPRCTTVQSIANSISAHSAKTRVQKPVASSRQTKHTHTHTHSHTHTHTHTQTKKHVFHFISIIKTRFPKESYCLHYCTHTNHLMHFLSTTITVFWFFHSSLSPFLLFRCRTFMLSSTCFVSFSYPMSL